MIPTLEFVAGSSLPFNLAFTKNEVGDDMSSLAEYKFWSTIKRDPDCADADALFRASTEPGADVTMTVVGLRVFWIVPPETTRQLAYMDRVDVKVQTPSGLVDTLMLKRLRPLREVTLAP